MCGALVAITWCPSCRSARRKRAPVANLLTAGLLAAACDSRLSTVAVRALSSRVQDLCGGLPQERVNSGVTVPSRIRWRRATLSQLSSSDAIAFRALFSTAARPCSSLRLLYWPRTRLPCGDVDGLTSHRPAPLRAPDDVTGGEANFYYTFVLEPHTALAVPAGDGGLAPPNACSPAVRQSCPTAHPQPHALQRSSDRRRPGGRTTETPGKPGARKTPADEFQSPRDRAAQSWRSSFADDEALMNPRHLLAVARNGSSISAPAAPPSAATFVDEFLFDASADSCEHFFRRRSCSCCAGAVVPARVVTGYHGGEFQPASTAIITVRHAEAHAWTAVFIAQRRLGGRVDPDRGVEFPGRVDSGRPAAALQATRFPPHAGGFRGAQFAALHLGGARHQWNWWVAGPTTPNVSANS